MTTTPRIWSLVRLLLAIAVGMALAYGALKWLRPGQPGMQPSTPMASARTLSVSLHINGREIGQGQGRIALPGNTRFELRVQVPGPGHLAVHNINPLGVRQAAPLFTQELTAAGPVALPAMRLAEPPGLDTLVFSFRPQSGAAEQRLELQIWHP